MTTALYRRYRPENFQDVIGQSHVTEPLMTALRKNKVNHAYLFSGPRGCGKTTSARILARCLNCAEGPTPTPCGHCESCMDLSRNGGGSLDVIEMDAASHGGVDDARQLRERATFAPVRDRYKIFIIDEAHMVTRDGFNALLKIVEEPPEHIKFIFATTEPNKVLPTIRSRTHHYPFRLVPPEPLMQYLQHLSAQESVGVEPGVMAMVVRAGGGSVRDSLSVLDQLIAGTDQDSVTYDLAVSLLGYTHGALLDDVVDAFASGNAATVFRAVDRVIQAGQDPRRFVEDLLERFRDLVIVSAVGEAAGNILHGMPEDQVSRLRNQAQLMGAAELSRAADITNEALTEMTGATSPQLHLELLCARLLLPSAENTQRGASARIDRLERRLNMGRTGAPVGPVVDLHPDAPQEHSAPAPVSAPVAQEPEPVNVPTHPKPEPAPAVAPEHTAPMPSPVPAAAASSTTQTQPQDSGIDLIRGSWTEIVNALADIHRVSWMTVMRATPTAFDGAILHVVFDAEGDRKNFPRFEPNLVAAIQEVLGISCRVEAIAPGEHGGNTPLSADLNSPPPGTAQHESQRTESGPPPAPEESDEPVDTWAVADIPSPHPSEQPQEQVTSTPTPEPEPQEHVTDDDVPPEQWRPTAERKLSFRERHAEHIAAAQTQSQASEPVGPHATDSDSDSDENFSPSDDDPTVDNTGVRGRAMIEKILGGRLVEEHPHSSTTK